MTTELDRLEVLLALITQRQMDLACQLKVQLGERPEDEKALTVVTQAQEKIKALQREDPVETCEENPGKKDTTGIQEVIPDTQVGDSIEGQRSGEEISVDCPLGIEFPFDGELFRKPGEPKVHLTRAEKRKHNQQWTEQLRSSQTTKENQRQKEPEQLAMTGTRLKGPKSNRMGMSHTTVKPETVTAERKQHAWELETMRQK